MSNHVQPLPPGDAGPEPCFAANGSLASAHATHVIPDAVSAGATSDGRTHGFPRRCCWSGNGQLACQWQWEHKTGFRDYKIDENEKIERHYRTGHTMVRLKSGKQGHVPMELFFEDMIQHDPVTGNTRCIRRLGPNGFMQRSRRWLSGIARSLETGRPRKVVFEQYQQHRKEIYRDLSCGYEEEDPLKRNGCCARIVRSQEFFIFSMTIVLLYVIWIAVDVEVNSAGNFNDLPTSFQVVEHTFCTTFLLELLVRFGAFRRMRDCLWDLWFVFDAVLVATQATEIWLIPLLSEGRRVPATGFLRVARMLRLLRLGRIMRVLRLFPEVLTLIKGISRAARSVCYTLLMLLVLLFVFATIFKSEAHEAEGLQQLFPSIFDAVCMLLLKGVLMDGATVTFYAILEDSWILAILFVVFIFLSAFVVLNMLIGILCDVVCQVSQIEKDDSAVNYLKSTLMDLLECYDKNDDKQLGKEEFELIMGNPEMHSILEHFDVDVSGLMSMKDVLFERMELDSDYKPFSGDPRSSTFLTTRGVSLGFTEFIKAILRLRGANAATVMDMVDLREYVGRRLDRMDQRLDNEVDPQEAPQINQFQATLVADAAHVLEAETDAAQPSNPRHVGTEEVAQLRREVREVRLLVEKLVQAQSASLAMASQHRPPIPPATGREDAEATAGATSSELR